MTLSHLAPLLGGMLIGTGAVLLLALSGRIAGVSGIVGGLYDSPKGDRAWRFAFLGGLWLGGLVLLTLAPELLPRTVPGGWPVALGAGLLVGVGTRAGNGCTSGHGVCGLGRRSRRSFAAVLVFMATGILTALFVRPWIGGAP
ncbi:YeeE/YedE family protein [Nannocystis pusilla]|jgi:uncharacterized protein|uniref:YeeE/YedE family protein n=1 Tax=Nannocystis pusilla TaxID=889268 RepID=UPI003DA48DA4